MREATIKPRPCTQTCLHWCVKTNKDTPTKVMILFMSLERMRSPVNSSSFVCTFVSHYAEVTDSTTKVFLKAPTVGRDIHQPHRNFSNLFVFCCLTSQKGYVIGYPGCMLQAKGTPARLHFLLRFSLPTTTQMEKKNCHLTMTRSMPGCVSVNGKCSSSARYCWTAIGNLAGVREPLVWCPVPTQINICSRCRVLLTLSRN